MLSKKRNWICFTQPSSWLTSCKEQQNNWGRIPPLPRGHHAEVDAITRAKENVSGATLYSNLEPCCHQNKRTPPCVDLILEKKISRVVVSNRDPNPKVNGRGLEKLRRCGVEVREGIMEHEGSILNEIFFKFIVTKMPFVHIKVAQTIDGKMCTKRGSSQWISGIQSRTQAHYLRLKYDAVLIGSGTLKRDNPRLTSRIEDTITNCPIRIVVGNPNEMSLSSNIFSDDYFEKTLIASTIPKSKINPKVFNKIRTYQITATKQKLFWQSLWSKLGEDQITSVLIEGGPTIINSILKEGQWDKITSFIAPKILGNGPSLYDSPNRALEDAILLKRETLEKIGNDMCLSGYRV